MSSVIVQRTKRLAPRVDVPAVSQLTRIIRKGLGQLQWAGCYATDWEIVIYEQKELWEACFFTRDLYHEHVTGPTLDEVRRRAEERIDLLESDENWRALQSARK